MGKMEAVILDWAGTTVDYGSFAPVHAFLEAFQQFGMDPTLAEVREPMGMRKWDHIHTMLQMPRIQGLWQQVHGKPWTRADVDAVYAASETAIFKVLARHTDLKPHTLEAVARLREMGIQLGSTTGYTDAMMDVVVPAAKAAGYAPDAVFTPDAVGGLGRPSPYMIFRNLEALGVSAVQAAVKVGDTVADILEGKHAGLLTVGVIEGSSVMGLTQAEYEDLSEAQQQVEQRRVRSVYAQCGADYTVMHLGQLPALLETLG